MAYVSYNEALNYFYKENLINPMTSSEQLVILNLLYINYYQRNDFSVQVTDRELELRTNLSKETIVDVKRTLKNLGWIDFKSDRDKPRRGTTYTFPFIDNLNPSPKLNDNATSLPKNKPINIHNPLQKNFFPLNQILFGPPGTGKTFLT